MAEELTCPKCQGPMRTHRRNGVTIEQCRRCHGIFLDAGELERLIGAESSALGHFGPDPAVPSLRRDLKLESDSSSDI